MVQTVKKVTCDKLGDGENNVQITELGLSVRKLRQIRSQLLRGRYKSLESTQQCRREW
jgi:hypothetical protein